MKIEKPAYPFAKIKDIWLEVSNCDFIHSHLGEGKGFFLGRKKAKEHLKMLLLHSKSQSGAYLVSGFRGMGKTSLVHEVLKELKDDFGDQRPYEKISISLSQDDVRDLDVLRLIARQLALKWKELYLRSFWYWVHFPAVALLALLILLGIALSHSENIYQCLLKGISQVLYTLALGLFFYLLYRWKYGKTNGQTGYKKIMQRLDFLNIRLDALITREQGASSSHEFSTKFGQRFSFSHESRNTQTYQIATTKEIEKELIGIFNEIEAYRLRPGKEQKFNITQRIGKFFRVIDPVPEFIFLLDELDKIEPDFIATPTPNELRHATGIAQSTQRRETVARLLSNLKSFLNEAKAKFIFVGGREMYDASLADIADRDSFYSSIFHDVIYLNSFFKDKIQQRAGVTRMTEAYLCHLLIPSWYIVNFRKSDPKREKETDPNEWYNLSTLYHYLVDCNDSGIGGNSGYKYQNALFVHSPAEKLTPNSRLAVYKIIYLLQNFVIYLTYRSNGTPKKLAGLVEQYVVPGVMGERIIDTSTDRYICDQGFAPHAGESGVFGNEIVLFCPPDPDVRTTGWFRRSLFSGNGTNTDRRSSKNKLFLKFNFNQQYEIGLTSNLYRPYVIIHSRHLKALGDKLLYSTAYIMDYILKFHPHGFSWRNLEMVPDIILTNKDPNLRTFMQELMQFLSRMYIRETMNGMFQFRFYNKVVNEIRFLSKISDQGTAAFNFTLDESQQIKQYYRDKLYQQQKRQEGQIQFAPDTTPYIHSTAFLQNLLGDLHYYDSEYDDAIIHYTEAAQPLRERIPGGNLTNHQVVLLVRTLLKLGMALEKIRAFDSAYSIYRSLIIDMPNLLQVHSKSEQVKNEELPVEPDRPLRRMQLFLRPYIAILDLVEKQRTDGVTFSNLRRNLEDMNKLLDVDRPYPILESTQKQHRSSTVPIFHKDNVRLNTLYSDYFSNVGSILYFKNYNFPEIYSCFKKGVTYRNAKHRLNHTYNLPEFKNENLSQFIREHRGEYGKDKPVFDYNPSLSAYAYYRLAISDQFASFKEVLFDVLREAGEFDRFVKPTDSELANVLLLLHPAAGYLTNSMQLYTMGNLFSKLGDAVLSSAGGNVRHLSEAVLKIYEHDGTGGDLKDHLLDMGLEYLRSKHSNNFPFDDCLNATLVLYRVAGLFYLKSNRSFSYAFQYKKFLFVVKDWLAFRGKKWVEGMSKPERESLLARLERLLIHDDKPPSIANRLFNSIAWTSDMANRPQLLKYRELLQVNRTQDTLSIYNNISTSPETREVVLIIEEIRLKLTSLWMLPYESQTEKPSERPPLELNIISPYDTISSKYLRVFELKYKCEYNYNLFKSYQADPLLKARYFNGKTVKPEFDNIWGKLSDTDKNTLEECLLDSIFCLYEVIRSLNIYGTDYVTNHSFLANAHYKLANWCRAFENFKDGRLRDKNVSEEKEYMYIQQYEDNLNKLLGTDALYALEDKYHDEQAIGHYYSAIQTHRGGRSYRDNVTNMSFMEDDLNDNLTHFSAATERFRINTGMVRAKIDALKQNIANSQVYEYKSYHGMTDYQFDNFNKLFDSTIIEPEDNLTPNTPTDTPPPSA